MSWFRYDRIDLPDPRVKKRLTTKITWDSIQLEYYMMY